MRTPGWLALVALTPVVAAACSSSDQPPAPLPSPDDFMDILHDDEPCALACDPTCQEATKVWKCQALADWNSIPHDPACGDFDGKTFPAPVAGKCVATDPTGEALAKAQIVQKPLVLPDGRRLAAAGNELVFSQDGGFPSSELPIPGTQWIAVSDYGYDTQSLRVIDAAALKSGTGNAETTRVKFTRPASLNYGLAYLAAQKVLLASSGSDASKVLAYDLDEATGALTADAAKDIALPKGTMPSAIDVSPDGKTLLVGQSQDTKVLVYSVDTGTYGTQLGSIDVGAKDLFALHFDPFDPNGHTAYATLWTSSPSFDDTSKMKLVQLDASAMTASIILVGKSPEEMVFLDARWMVVANALSDTLSLVDRPAAKVAAEVQVSQSHGPSPTTLAYDPANKRLYATLAAENAVEVFDVDTSAPSITPAGSFPTGWWPTAVSVDPNDGTVFVLTGRGHGIGLDPQHWDVGVADEAKRMAGSIAAVPFMDSAALATSTTTVTQQNDVSQVAGYPTVQCNGAPYDFPVPQKPEDGPSTKIKHVFLIIRENKTFDGIMGDRPGVDGQADVVLAPGNMDKIWPDTFAIAKQFAQMDNYYIDAEQSIQGHVWTVFGRSTDYTERRWLTIWGRSEFGVINYSPGVGDDTTPAEGNLFQFLLGQNVTVDNQGEFVGGLAVRDLKWPGGSAPSQVPDTYAACYEAGRLRVLCNPKDFTYSWMGNDHTYGTEPGKPNPALMIAVNDEATGMYLDALSHSPFWPDSLVIVTEDDPSQGGDHVDVHRTIAEFASPWIKRGYVSHAHYDISSIHKLISLVYGKPYRDSTIADAAIPYDIFTSTPDYTPFTYVPRQWDDLSCNPGSANGQSGGKWDFSEPDDQPGLGEDVSKALHALPR